MQFACLDTALHTTSILFLPTKSVAPAVGIWALCTARKLYLCSACEQWNYWAFSCPIFLMSTNPGGGCGMSDETSVTASRPQGGTLGTLLKISTNNFYFFIPSTQKL